MPKTARNHPCPCGSGQRFKNCCGQQGATPGNVVAAPGPLRAIDAVEATGGPLLSIVMPYYKKLADFTPVLEMNRRYFARSGIEVVLALDENSEEAGLIALLEGYPDISWKIIVNDVAHPWRPPCKSINVGIRHARGHYILVVSPESAFVGDLPGLALDVLHANPDGIAIGRVGFAPFTLMSGGQSLEAVFQRMVPDKPYVHTFYGSICAPRQAFEAVHGYDEAFTEYGGDDDNIRIRMEMAGYTLLACPALRILHFSRESRPTASEHNQDNEYRACTPATPLVNRLGWGQDFARLAYVSPHRVADIGTQRRQALAPPQLPEHVPTGSLLRCQHCGRLIHYEAPQMYCPTCAVEVQATPVPGSAPRIVCLMQLHNEERYLASCFAHLRDYVDGFIVLDDASTDGTAGIIAAEAKVLDCLTNPPDPNHVWNQVENKLRLLRRAQKLGFQWVLVCDADERFEMAFLRDLRLIAESLQGGRYNRLILSLRELWNHPGQYRIDGIWDRKAVARFFRLPEQIALENAQPFHGQWYPDQIAASGLGLRCRYNLYHLKSIRHEDRVRRRDFNNRVDPEKRCQAIGYDYLAEEGEDLRLETIRPGREYQYLSLPDEYRAALESNTSHSALVSRAHV